MTTNDSTATAGAFLQWATKVLSEADIPTSRLDSLILMEDVLAKDRAHLLTHPELLINEVQLRTLHKLVDQRKEHTPIAYLRGKVMFYGRNFFVTRDTLVPRPESEDMITLLKTELRNSGSLAIADIGTGSGCLGITAALELHKCTLGLYDIDAKTLTVSKMNTQLLGVSGVRYFHEDLLSKALHRRYDVVLANLPYVPDGYAINKDAEFEPKVALFSGVDGLDDYRTFWCQVEGFATKPRYILTESQPETQHAALVTLATTAGYEPKETLGFIQLFSLA
jgi:release factor glutamine methyltransferase